MIFKNFFARAAEPELRAYALPEGERVYAIGDIHGRRDCLDALIGLIDIDNAARGVHQKSADKRLSASLHLAIAAKTQVRM